MDLLEKMLSFNPAERPSAVKCLQHPFFQCYEVLKFYGVKFNNNDDAEKKERDTFAGTQVLGEEFRGDMNDSFGKEKKENTGNKFEEFLTNNS